MKPVTMHRLREIHDELLQSIGKAGHQLGRRELTTFFPMRGAAATGELMVVGRAVNGWAKKFTADEALVPERRAEIIQDVLRKAIRQTR